MALADEIMQLVQARPASGPLCDPREGRNRLVSLARALGGHVDDETEYPSARAYRFHHALLPVGERNWRSELRITVSAVGPYATHNFLLRANQEAWWATVLRTSRTGFGPEDAPVLDRLRTWYRENDLTEVDVHTQAHPAPGEDAGTLYRLLFLP